VRLSFCIHCRRVQADLVRHNILQLDPDKASLVFARSDPLSSINVDQWHEILKKMHVVFVNRVDGDLTVGVHANAHVLVGQFFMPPSQMRA
jgi:hypothetical protein